MGDALRGRDRERSLKKAHKMATGRWEFAINAESPYYAGRRTADLVSGAPRARRADADRFLPRWSEEQGDRLREAVMHGSPAVPRPTWRERDRYVPRMVLRRDCANVKSNIVNSPIAFSDEAQTLAYATAQSVVINPGSC